MGSVATFYRYVRVMRLISAMAAATAILGATLLAAFLLT